MAGIAFAGEAFPEQLGAPDEAAVEFIAEVAAEPAEAAVDAIGVIVHDWAESVSEKGSSRKRARHPKGTAKAGEFVADDPATPENEAFEDGKATIRG